MEMKLSVDEIIRPATYATQALDAIEVSDARRKRRKRDTSTDLHGMDLKRDLLRAAIEADPEPDEFEGWLMQQVIEASAGGAIRAMAMEILADYENARAVQSFGGWLAEGAPTPSAFPRERRKKKKQNDAV